jgi:UDP-glucose 4-epimerase
MAVESYLALYHHLHGLDYAVLRLANPFGPGQRAGTGQGAVAAFMSAMAQGQAIQIWGDGSVVRDYLFIDDAVEAISMAGAASTPAAVWNVGSGAGRSLNEVLAGLEALLGVNAQVERLAPRSFDVPSNVLDCTAISTQLGWTPKHSFDEGLRLTWAWFQEQQR